MPPGGAFDRESFFLANALLDNPATAPVVEIPLLGGSFRCEADTTVALVGAWCQVLVNGSRSIGQCRLPLSAKDELTVEPYTQGVRLYLAAPEGTRAKLILGSCSGNPVVKEDLLESSAERRMGPARLAQPPHSIGTNNGPVVTLRFLPGPQASSFDLERFQCIVFKVSTDSDRKGVRLVGEVEGDAAEIASEPACFGAVQVTRSGNPILLGPDGPTIGGYPKIATVISADLDKVAQLGPGAAIAFEQVDFDQAISLWRDRARRLEVLARQLKLDRS